MKKIGIFLINKQFIRSWIDSGLIHHLEATGKFQVTVFAGKEIFPLLPTDGSITTSYLGEIKSSIWTKHTLAMGYAKLAKRSSTFQFKTIRKFFPETLFIPRHGNLSFKVAWFMRSFYRFLGNLSDNWFTLLYFLPPARFVIRRYVSNLKESFDLPSEIKKEHLDWLVIPAASGIGYVTDLLAGAKSAGLKTLISIDNWDHFTGKSIYPIKPNYFTVMGKLDVQHAVKIHDCHPSQVLPIGLPRFDFYRSINHECLETKPKDTKRVLYLGFSLAHSEEFLVDFIAEQTLQRYGHANIEIHYRPHPGPWPRFDGFKLKNPHVLTTKYGDLGRTAMPDMDDEFLNELLLADVVVGPPTTLFLEAMLVGKVCVLDLTNDGFHRTTAGNSAKWHTHMQDLTKIPNLPMAHSKEDLVKQVHKALDSEKRCDHQDVADLFNLHDPLFREQLATFLEEN